MTISPVEMPDLDEYSKHWTLGTKAAWFSRERHDVLVLDESTRRGVMISGLPREYGWISAAGWEKDRDFFVHFQEGSDGGTMVYIDTELGMVTRIEPWTAW